MVAMVVTLPGPEVSYSWKEYSVLAAKAMGHGVKHTQNLHKWIKDYLHREKLPLHQYGTYHLLILEDEDFFRDIQLHLMEIAKNKGTYMHKTWWTMWQCQKSRSSWEQGNVGSICAQHKDGCTN